MRTAHSILAVAVATALAVAAWADGAAYREIPTPHFRTDVITFEDTFLYPTPPEGSLIYRTEGHGKATRICQGYRQGLAFLGAGAVSYIHPAMYGHATLRLLLHVDSGVPLIRIAHNGMTDRAGHRNPSPGVEVALRAKDTVVRDLSTGKALAVLPAHISRRVIAPISVAWDHDTRRLRVDLAGHSYEMPLPPTVTRRGGFAIAAPAKPSTRFTVKRIQVLWQDNRDLVLYDGYDTVYDVDGKPIGRVAPVKLPAGMTNYSTCAVDLKNEKSLIVYGGPDINSDHPKTLKGFAVRDLRTGHLDDLGHRPNGCLPLQGGGSMDGVWLLQSWTPPASTSWLDWNAWERGDRAHFIVPFQKARVDGRNFVAFHDPSNALDGSMARYLRITQTWIGVDHLTVHPDLAPYAPFEDVAFPPPPQPNVSHTGPAGKPTQLAVRDRDRAWYEEWAHKGDHLHDQCRGYNLWTRRDDWQGPFYPPVGLKKPYEDFVNMVPALCWPGKLLVPLARFDPSPNTAKRVKYVGTFWAHVAPGRFVIDRKVSSSSWKVPFQMLMDPTTLRPLPPTPGG